MTEVVDLYRTVNEQLHRARTAAHFVQHPVDQWLRGRIHPATLQEYGYEVMTRDGQHGPANLDELAAMLDASRPVSIRGVTVVPDETAPEGQVLVDCQWFWWITEEAPSLPPVGGHKGHPLTWARTASGRWAGPKVHRMAQAGEFLHMEPIPGDYDPDVPDGQLRLRCTWTPS